MDDNQGAATRGPFTIKRDVSVAELITAAVVAFGVAAWFVRTGDNADNFKAFVVQQRVTDKEQDAQTEKRIDALRNELRGDIREVSDKIDRLLERGGVHPR